MMPVEGRWEILETIGAYAAGELEGEVAREAERLIFEREVGTVLFCGISSSK